jgi:hypothetical protein
MKYLLIISLLFSQITYAQDAVLLEQGKAAPFSGYLLSRDKVVELKNNTIDLEYSRKENNNLKLIQTDYEKRLNLYIEQNDKLSERLHKSDTGFLEKSGYFIFGALITGLLAYGTTKSLK